MGPVIEGAIRCHKQIHRKCWCVRIFGGDVIYNITKASKENWERKKETVGRLVTDTNIIPNIISIRLNSKHTEYSHIHIVDRFNGMNIEIYETTGRIEMEAFSMYDSLF